MKNNLAELSQLNILQVCRLTPLWGVDLFKQTSLAYQHHKVTTLFLSGKRESAFACAYHGEVIFFEVDHKKPSWRFKAAFKLWKLCRKHRFDMVICHHYKPTVLMNWVSYFCKTQYYFSVHHTLGNLRRLGRRLYTRLSLKRKWQFIAVSDSVKKDLVKAGAGISNAQVKTVYNTIILDEVINKQLPREEARKKLGISPHDFVFGTIGRLVNEKGHLPLIQAFANISQRIPHAILVILGTGPLEASLRNFVEKLGLHDKVLIDSVHAKEA